MSNKISRRNFLHTAGLGTLGAAAAGLLTACGDKAASGSVASSAAAGTYTAGTYSATATGINTTTPVTVTMTFSADAITDVQIDVANETKGYGADIADEMVKKILDAQSSEVDGHSGATITSDAIKKAAESCINQAKGVAVAPTEASKAETVVPDGLTTEEVESSVVELGDITPDETKDFDVVVVGAGAAGVPAAGWAAELGGHVALLQKQSIVVSQGNCGSAIIKSKSTEAGKKMWVHMTNGLCDWRADTSLLNAYVENSEEALMWYLNRAGLTDQTEYGDGSLVDSNKDPSSLLHNDEKEIFAYMCTSQDLTGVWKDRMDTYDFGDEHCYFFAPWIGPKPKNVGDVLANTLASAGLQVLHDRTIYDYPSYTGSYNRSGAAVQEYLNQYPSLRIVIDLHRDALCSDSVVYKTVAELPDAACSQVMLLVGTNASGLYHPYWEENLRLAVYLQDAVNAAHPTLMRPITLVNERYNQHLTRGSLIIEVGSSGNTLQEAIRAVRLFGESAGPALARLVQ